MNKVDGSAGTSTKYERIEYDMNIMITITKVCRVKMKFIINIIIAIPFQFCIYTLINASTCLGFLSTNNNNNIINNKKKKLHDHNFQFRTYHGVVTRNRHENPPTSILLLRAKKDEYYNYFAFGSNMELSTMTALRGINPISYQPAILPNHKLSFNVPGTPFIEPSWASVEPVIQNETIDSANIDDDNFDNKSESSKHFVHGILYKLSENDFEKICSSEGVPFAYTLHRCRVIPYIGDGLKAGKEAYNCQIKKITQEKYTMDQIGVPAFTLRAARKKWRNQTEDIPPSVAYMNVIIKGAEQFKIDSDYVKGLKMIPTGRTIGNGMSDKMLDSAVFLQSIRRNFI